MQKRGDGEGRAPPSSVALGLLKYCRRCMFRRQPRATWLAGRALLSPCRGQSVALKSRAIRGFVSSPHLFFALAFCYCSMIASYRRICCLCKGLSRVPRTTHARTHGNRVCVCRWIGVKRRSYVVCGLGSETNWSYCTVSVYSVHAWENLVTAAATMHGGGRWMDTGQ